MADIQTDAAMTSAEGPAWGWHLAGGITVDSVHLGSDAVATPLASAGYFADQVAMAIATTIANLGALQHLGWPARPESPAAFARLVSEIATLAAHIRAGIPLRVSEDVRRLAEEAARATPAVVDVDAWAAGLAGDLSPLADR